MATKYIPCMDGTRRTIMEYDTEKGFDQKSTTCIFIFHRSLIVSAAYDTLDAALKSWGEWSEKPVRLPDGTDVAPVERFHPKEAVWMTILKPWHPGVTEVVCDPRRVE